MATNIERLAGVLRAVALLAALATLAAVGSSNVTGAVAPAGDCDNTCEAGKTNDKDPCITSGKGKCVPSATAPAGTVCVGCAFAPATDDKGNVVGCTTSCTAITK